MDHCQAKRSIGEAAELVNERIQEIIQDFSATVPLTDWSGVDESVVPDTDCKQTIARPICLRDMAEKAKDRVYQSKYEFMDLGLMRAHCFRYNAKQGVGIAKCAALIRLADWVFESAFSSLTARIRDTGVPDETYGRWLSAQRL
eukprot:m51a1_g3172 hypothetical protein (144) ;mRNA; f:396517-397146